MVSNSFTLSKLLLLPLAFHLVNAVCPARLTATPGQPDIVDNPACPRDQGKAVIGHDGTHFMLQCCTKKRPGANQVGRLTHVQSKKDCVNKCLSTTYPTCDSVEYDNSKKTCTFFTLGDFSTEDAGGDLKDWLYFINPPARPAPDNITHMCSTDCPAAHVPFKEEKTLTYRDCLDGCAKLPKCLSIDWSSRTKMCYYGKHSGAAPIVAPAYNSAYSFGCAGACNKEDDACACGQSKSSKSSKTSP
ncbi:hypothetical protein EYZ11_012617 [Aspergillus tanneri]|uniref:Apple domain-containing protein n=1 Tax=Aspergillus tanneri TaxID=1220188 RepID=A0A4V3UMN0_9EURO|nr:hypothetical protein EYZ11_012617 [Aspergillus tanneri]